jgi:hypothetical protein
MTLRAAALALAASILVAGPSGAQAPAMLSAGTPVMLRTVQPLSSRDAIQGQRFPLEVTEDVLVQGALVIPKGARGTGEVSRVVEKGMFGKSGKLEVRVLFVEAGGTRIRLDGEVRDKGKSNLGPVVLAAPLIGLSAAFVSGTHAIIPAGTLVTGRVFQDLPLVRPGGNEAR